MKYEQQYYMQDRISIEDHDDEFPNLLNELLQERKDETELHDIYEKDENIRSSLSHLNSNATGIKITIMLEGIKSIPRNSILLRGRSDGLTHVRRLDYAAEMIARKLNVSSTWRPNYTVMQCITMIREGNNEIQDYHN